MRDPDYSKAKKRVEIKISFFIHLAVYVLVNILLVVINLTAKPGVIWFKWPHDGMGYRACDTWYFSHLRLLVSGI